MKQLYERYSSQNVHNAVPEVSQSATFVSLRNIDRAIDKNENVQKKIRGSVDSDKHIESKGSSCDPELL